MNSPEVDAYGVRRAVLRQLAAVAPGSMPGGKLRAQIRSTQRHALEGVLAELARDGVIVYRPAPCGGRRFTLARGSNGTTHQISNGRNGNHD